ncbi:MAG: hypothetical protein ACHQ5A_09870 [Opitutales bacterium]
MAYRMSLKTTHAAEVFGIYKFASKIGSAFSKKLGHFFGLRAAFSGPKTRKFFYTISSTLIGKNGPFWAELGIFPANY